MSKNDKFSVLVNSSDGFEDCWDPFFILFQKYWESCDGRIFLNTERKNWFCRLPEVTPTQVALNDKEKLSWSECLLRALELVDTPLVLYLQEDYFLESHVRTDVVTRAVDFMVDNPGVGHISLSRHGSLGGLEPHKEAWLKTIPRNARYRISTQAALWRVDTLKSYLCNAESGWMFEIYGTWRSRLRTDNLLCADYSVNTGGPAFCYMHTGIIKGKWNIGVPALFAENGIDVDFYKRGFYEAKPYLMQKMELAQKILKHPGHLVKQLYLRYGNTPSEKNPL